MRVVVDTNVAVVANGKSEQASEQCVDSCAERLEQIMYSGVKLVLDDDWRILDEYMRNLHSRGADIGDRFLAWSLQYRTNPERCDSVPITPVNGLENEFEEFPEDPALEDFDPDDRKFVAVALAHCEKPPILQAVDTKWLDFRDALDRNGVMVEFVCQDDIHRLRGKS